ncbi:MAG: hypothetical protein ACT4OD_01315 [Candidatus Nitrosotenuis sp.]
MDGLDVLLSKAIAHSIQEKLDSGEIQSINKKLEQKDNIKFEGLFNKYSKIQNIKYQFTDDLKNIEDEVLRNFLTVEKTTYDTYVIITDKRLAETILKTFADKEKKLILDFTRDRSETIPRILNSCNLPNTSGYRKVKQLIEDGFVVPDGLAESFEGKRAVLYKSSIQKIQIMINKDQVVTSILIPKETFRTSEVINTVLFINQRDVKNLAN